MKPCGQARPSGFSGSACLFAILTTPRPLLDLVAWRSPRCFSFGQRLSMNLLAQRRTTQFFFARLLIAGAHSSSSLLLLPESALSLPCFDALPLVLAAAQRRCDTSRKAESVNSLSFAPP